VFEFCKIFFWEETGQNEGRMQRMPRAFTTTDKGEERGAGASRRTEYMCREGRRKKRAKVIITGKEQRGRRAKLQSDQSQRWKRIGQVGWRRKRFSIKPVTVKEQR